MSRTQAAETLPHTARSIALLLASTPGVQDAQPGVLHQLLEFSHRYTAQILSDASVYAEHAGRSGKIEMEDVTLAVQARVGWEFGGRVPKEYLLSLASEVNAIPLPSVPEVFGVRLPPPLETLTAINFDLVPNKPPPGVKLYDEQIEEIEESEDEGEEEEDDEDMEPAPIPAVGAFDGLSRPVGSILPGETVQTPSDMDIMPENTDGAGEEGSDAGEDEDGLFAGGDEEEEEEEAMEEVQTGLEVATNDMKRKLVEEEDYD